jgi:membrane protease YdiL (CAAX protease family)
MAISTSTYSLMLSLAAYPVLEEFIFRRHGMPWAEKKLAPAGPVAVNATVSAFFVLAHLVQWPWTHAVLTFVPSMALGALYQRTGRWTWCAAAHAAMNAAYLCARGALCC